MASLTRKHKRLVGAGILTFCLFTFLTVGLLRFVTPAYAQVKEGNVLAEVAAGAAEGGCLNGGMVGTPCPQKGHQQFKDRG